MKIPRNIKSSIPFKYAYDVQKGKIIVGKKIKLAIQRFFDRIDNAENLGYRLNHTSGMHIIEFSEKFVFHSKGPLAGSEFVLSPFQQFTLYNVMAWEVKNTSGEWVRLTKTVYEKVGRKNGKTALLAMMGLYFQGCDNESAPEIYVGATKEAQAKVLWEQAYQFVFKSQALRRFGFKNTQREIRFSHNLGVFRFLGGDSKTLDGLNPSLSILDEYHAHPNDGVREVLESAMGARKNPLMYIITTAGFDVAGVCVQYEQVCIEILEGRKSDDSTWIMIHDIDKDDDWNDESTWIKANPNLNVSISIDYLRSEYQKCKNQPSKIPNFKTKHLNQYVDAPEVWIPAEVWEKNKRSFDVTAFGKARSCAGLDLAATKDLTAYVYLSEPNENEERYLKPFFFMPKETIDARSKEDRVPYRAWVDAGYIIATEGSATDYDLVKDIIVSTSGPHGLKTLYYDGWNASNLVHDLSELGIPCEKFAQGIGSMSWPTKQFERLVLEGKLLHDGNPVLSWMLAGCVIYRDANDNIKVHKGKSNRRVDGIVAAIMAYGGSLSVDDTSKISKYSKLNPDEICIGAPLEE